MKRRNKAAVLLNEFTARQKFESATKMFPSFKKSSKYVLDCWPQNGCLELNCFAHYHSLIYYLNNVPVKMLVALLSEIEATLP